MTFTSDELILILISLVRATRPNMLRQESDGFSVDFEVLTGKENLNDDDRLLIKLREAIDGAKEDQPLTLNLAAPESLRLVSTLSRLEKIQTWPADVLAMSRDLRQRLIAAK
jgi:hypothetical protein